MRKRQQKVADSYQLVIAEILKTQSLGNLLSDGQEWLFFKLNTWSKPIVEAGMIDFSLVQKLKTDFKEVIDRKGEKFFGWFHGNIIGDHVVISGEDVYLLDLNAVPRAGRGYHDFLRALDFMFLKSTHEDQLFASIPKWMKAYLSEFDETEVQLVFCFQKYWYSWLGHSVQQGAVYKGRFGEKETIIPEIHQERILNSKSQKRKPDNPLLIESADCFIFRNWFISRGGVIYD